MKTRSLRSLKFNYFYIFIVLLIILGIFFRFANLDQKVYWHDEVYTSIRASGFTRYEIDQEIFQDKIISIQELQKFQKIKPESTLNNTIHSLAVEDPQHPPLYFIIARLWMQLFGNSLTASRSLSVLLSLLSLPLIYQLSLELFGTNAQLTAGLATVFLSLSPCDILFAQTNRQYSLLTVTIIGSSWLLLKSLKTLSWKNWILYTLACTIGLYTHLFFALTLIAQGIFAVVYLSKKRELKILGQFWLSLVASLFLYGPWLVVLKHNYQRALDTTNWTNTQVDLMYLIKLWILSFTSLFIDLDFGFNNPWTYLLRLPFILLIFLAIYTIFRRTSHSTRLFILLSTLIPFLLLVIPDLILGGKRSAVTRYLISCFPTIQLAVAYLFTHQILGQSRRIWQIVFAFVISSSILSGSISLVSDTWWNKDLSYFNNAIAKKVNKTQSPLIISDIGDDWTNTGDLISLSYFLKKDSKLLLLENPSNIGIIQAITSHHQFNQFIFRPSQKLEIALKKEGYRFKLIIPDGRFWQIKSR